MLFLRTAAGGFVDAATIVRLSNERDGREIGWVAICEDGRKVALAPYYNAPGRLKDLQHLVPSSTSHAAPVEAASLPKGCGCDCVL